MSFCRQFQKKARTSWLGRMISKVCRKDDLTVDVSFPGPSNLVVDFRGGATAILSWTAPTLDANATTYVVRHAAGTSAPSHATTGESVTMVAGDLTAATTHTVSTYNVPHSYSVFLKYVVDGNTYYSEAAFATATSGEPD